MLYKHLRKALIFYYKTDFTASAATKQSHSPCWFLVSVASDQIKGAWGQLVL